MHKRNKIDSLINSFKIYKFPPPPINNKIPDSLNLKDLD